MIFWTPDEVGDETNVWWMTNLIGVNSCMFMSSLLINLASTKKSCCIIFSPYAKPVYLLYIYVIRR